MDGKILRGELPGDVDKNDIPYFIRVDRVRCNGAHQAEACLRFPDLEDGKVSSKMAREFGDMPGYGNSSSPTGVKYRCHLY